MRNLKELVLENLVRSPFGRRILSEAERAEQLGKDRVAWIVELRALRAEREAKVPALAAKSQEILAKAQAQIFAAHAAAMQAQAEFYEVELRTSGRISRLEQQLRRSADPRFAANGAVMSQLGEISQHLYSHSSCSLHLTRQSVQDLRKDQTESQLSPQDADRLAGYEREIALADASALVRAKVTQAIMAIQDLPLTEVPDVGAAMRTIVGKIPSQCPCGWDLVVQVPRSVDHIEEAQDVA